jgi:hypothetical protein
VLSAFLAFLAVLLRLWVTSGELLLASLGYIVDYKRNGVVETCSSDAPPPANSAAKPAARLSTHPTQA